MAHCFVCRGPLLTSFFVICISWKVLHEIHDARNRSVLLAGVMDGHGGMAASTMLSETLPTVLSRELLLNDSIPSVEVAMKHAWDEVCQMYRNQCSEDSCAADYDPKEGILMANTGSGDLIAGSTASMFGLDETSGSLTVLNCGDSRTIVVAAGKVTFATKDHTPQVEQERLMKGIEAGLDYSFPQCRVGRWYLPVGEYEYALCRALEGPFATSKGIVSDPDLTTLKAQTGMTLMSASDGLWDVMDNFEVANYLTQAREVRQMTARDAAKKLANRAIEKGTADNVSVVVVYL
jgi:serine/threonine protein phosphatase PrpC